MLQHACIVVYYGSGKLKKKGYVEIGLTQVVLIFVAAESQAARVLRL